MNLKTRLITPFSGIGATASLILLLLTVAPSFVLAGKQVPFKASYTTQFQSVVAFPIVTLSITGEGQASHLGRSTAATTNQAVNLITGAATATYTLTAANGDTVVLELVFGTTNVPGGVTFHGSYTVAGGTGRFAGASGSGSLNGSATFTGPIDGFGAFSVEGTISSPGGAK